MAQPADVKVERGWARATVQGQSSSGAYMTLTAKDGARLVGISSPMAGVVEVHEMKMDGDVMKMRGVPELELPAGKKIELKPGGYHVMVMDLNAPLVKGSTFPLTLEFKNSKGAPSKLDIELPIATTAPAAQR